MALQLICSKTIHPSCGFRGRVVNLLDITKLYYALSNLHDNVHHMGRMGFILKTLLFFLQVEPLCLSKCIFNFFVLQLQITASTLLITTICNLGIHLDDQLYYVPQIFRLLTVL